MGALLKGSAAVLGALALLYVGMLGWMYARQRDLVYFPQATRVPADQTDFAVHHDGVTLRGWMVHPGQPGAVLYFGGNAESIEGMRGRLAQWVPARSSYLVAYRGFGASDGVPGESALFADAVAVFDHVQARHPGAPVAVIGRSLGSGVAAYLASQRPVDRLVLVTPFDSLANVAQAHYRWFPLRRLLKDHYESTRYLARYHGRVLVIRAGRDEVIPAASTDRLVSSLARPPRVVDLPAASHNTVDDDPAYGAALSAFLE